MENICDEGYFWTVTKENYDNLSFTFSSIADSLTSAEGNCTIVMHCPVEVTISYDGEYLTSEGVTGKATATFGYLTASGTGDDRQVSVTLYDYDSSYDISIQGTGTGTMDLTITAELSESTYTWTFSDVPIDSDATQITMSTLSAGAGARLYIDSDGNGSTDSTMTARAVSDDDDDPVSVGDSDTDYTITASAGSHGTISPEGETSVTEGSRVKYTITPDKYYEIDEVYVDGESVGSDDSYTFRDVSEDHEISVTFSRVNDDYPGVTATTDTNGKVTPSSAYILGDDPVTFTITADKGYTLKDVLVNGISVLDEVVANEDGTWSYTRCDTGPAVLYVSFRKT